MSQKLIRKCISNASLRREYHRDSGGWGEGKRMRSQLIMPMWLALQPEVMKLLCPEGADAKEQDKTHEYLRKKFPKFVTHT